MTVRGLSRYCNTLLCTSDRSAFEFTSTGWDAIEKLALAALDLDKLDVANVDALNKFLLAS